MAVEPIRSGYDEMQWETGPQAEEYLKAWQQGRTGFPLVDAGGWVIFFLQSAEAAS
jgi:deoxyribodipyrimidine photo-lyase